MKILAIPNAHALAHVSRLLEIAKALRARGHSVLFAGHGKYLQVANWDGFPIAELPGISVEQLVRAVRSQKLWELYPEPQLEAFIEAELGLYDKFQPDLVLLDNRPSARTSSEKAGLKSVSVLNVHMSNHKRIPFYSLGNHAGWDSFAGLKLLDRLENANECFFYDRLVMGGLNRIRHRLGLPRLYGYEHEEGDLALFADIPEFSPVRRLPPNARYVGPLTWHNTLPAPACLHQLQAGKPTVYLSLGSDSLEELLHDLVVLARRGIQIVVATGGAAVERDLSVPEGVFLENYVNTDVLLPYCDLVCCHGGNGTIYQALAFGLPLVVVATHAEQHYGGKRIQRLGLGRALTLKAVKKKGLQVVVEAMREVLGDSRYRAKAREFSGHLRDWNSAELSATAVESYMSMA